MAVDSLSQFKLAAVVVLYNPDKDVVASINSYESLVDYLIIVDNTINPDQQLIDLLKKTLPDCYYTALGSNEGIAKALNTGIDLACKKGYKFILTMDQDSTFSEIHFSKYYDVAKQIDWNGIGIIAPVHVHGKADLPLRSDQLLVEKEFVMASGNIINVQAFNVVNGFEESFFIDHVDHDYCFRLKKAGYKILEVCGVELCHELGDVKHVTIFNKPVYSFISHSPQRCYYFIRNGFEMAKRHNEIAWHMYFLMFKEFVKTLFLENCKRQRLKAFKKGFSDFKSKSFGKLALNSF